MFGVTSVGVFANTNAPVPVSSVTAVAKLADDGVAKNARTPAAAPAKLATGNPVVFVSVPADGVPMLGVVRIGLVPNTRAPVPVSSVTAVARFAEDGVARNAAIPAASPEMPEATGNPVQFVSTPDVGVPRRGVINVGLVLNTFSPVPVSSVTIASMFAEDGAARNAETFAARPATPVEIGRPVAFVRTAADGVPRFGVVNTGFVANTKSPVPVSLVTAAARFADVGVARKVEMPVARPETPVLIGKPVQFVRVPDDGVPSGPPVASGSCTLLLIMYHVVEA